MTAIIARVIALSELDIKKVVALSTLSQLGLIVIMLGLRNSLIRFIHLLTHAYLKAMIFIAVGSLIRGNKGYQDLRLVS